MPAARRFVPLCAAFVVAAGALAQSIVTVAGGATDDGRPPADAILGVVSSIVVSGAGDLLFLDNDRHLLRKIGARTRLVETIGGNGSVGSSGDGGQAVYASISGRACAVLDREGNVYVHDAANQRIRRIDARTGIISHVVQTGPQYGFGAIALDLPVVYYSQYATVQSVDLSTGVVTAIAGGGADPIADYVPATSAKLDYVYSLALTPDGNLLIADNYRVRSVSLAGRVIHTVAGNGESGTGDPTNGDGGPATAAKLPFVSHVAVDAEGNVLIDGFRRLDARTGLISTLKGLPIAQASAFDAGRDRFVVAYRSSFGFVSARDLSFTLGPTFGGRTLDGPARGALLRFPHSFVPDPDGRGGAFINADGTVRGVRFDSDTLSTVAGGGTSKDREVAATSALIAPVGLSALPGGDLVFGDLQLGNAVRRLRRDAGTLTVVAGIAGSSTDAGDGGPAVQASLSRLRAVSSDPSGNVFLSTVGRVRRIDAAVQTIGTVAGTGVEQESGDGGPAKDASVQPWGTCSDAFGNLFVISGSAAGPVSTALRIRRVDAATGLIAPYAGGGDFYLDHAPATTAAVYTFACSADKEGDLYFPQFDSIMKVDHRTGYLERLFGGGATLGDLGPAFAAGFSATDVIRADDGTFYIADGGNNRIRAVFPCRDRLGAFDPSSPPDGTTAAVDTLSLLWSGAEGAFRYDVLVDESFPPSKSLQNDVTGQAMQVSGLAPGKTYFWRVRAKGDPNCPAVQRDSSVRRFTVPAPCTAPAAPSGLSASVQGTTATLSFTASGGASSYDVLLGAGAPTAKTASGGATAFTVSGLAPGTTYRWQVAARASCDPELTRLSAPATFTVPGSCVASAPGLLAPAAGSTVAPASTLRWTATPGASSYDVYLGTSEPLPLVSSGRASTSLDVTLAPGRTYACRVVARSACDEVRTAASETRSFSTAASACAPPAAPEALSTSKTSAFAGSTYALAWAPVAGAVSYRVERARPDGGSESFTTGEPSLLLRASERTTWSHRVRALASCGEPGAWSGAVTVTAAASPPALTIVRAPRALVIPQPAAGEPLPRVPVELENDGASDFVGFFNTSQTVPFFLPSETAISLRVGERRVYYLQMTGVASDRPGSYEGLLAIQSSDPSATTILPQMNVSLRITAQKAGAALPATTPPSFLQGGVPVTSVRFTGDSSSEVLVDVRNEGSAPLDLAADVLPESWVTVLDASSAFAWNAEPIAPNGARTVRLRVERSRSGSAGAYPRFAYLTVRTIDGKSSRLLIEDPGPAAASACAGRPILPDGQVSWIVPSLVNASAQGGGRYVSSLLVTNFGSDPVQADLYYTPDGGEPGVSGFDCGKVLFASVVVPGLDALAMRDPVGRLFGVEGSGQLEVRSSRAGQLRVQSVVDAPAAAGGSFGFQLPTIRSGSGARPGAPEVVLGVRQDARFRTNLILAETSGEQSSVTITLYDGAGARIGAITRKLPPWGKKQLPVAQLAPAGALLPAGALEITADEGSAGSVAAVVTVIDGRSGDASSFLARPAVNASRSKVYAIPSVVVSPTFRSRVEIRNNDDRPVTYTLRYRGSGGTSTSAARTLAPKAEDAWSSVLEEVFRLAPTSFGPLFVESDSPNLAIVSRVYSEQPSGSYGDAIEGVATDDLAVTGENGLLLATDGLEGTAENDRTRGARTNLILTEIGGAAADLEVAVWEKTQRRVAPAGTITVHLEPNQQKQINDVFGDEGFAIGQRDHLNVLCTVRGKPGSTGRVIALATRIDNLTQDTKNLVLRP